MTDQPTKLSDTARALLTVAATRDDHLIRLPRLPAAAARQVIRSLPAARSAEEVPAPIEDAEYAWRTGEDGQVLMLRATHNGLARLMDGAGMKTAATPVEAAVDSVAATSERTAGAAPEPTAPLIEDTPASAGGNARVGLVSDNRPTGAPTPFQITVNPVAVRKADRPVGRTDNLRQAAQAVLAAWDTNARHNEGVGNAMDGPLAALRGAFVSARPIGNDSCSLKDTKQAQVIAMLGREGGASGPQIAEAMGWAAHTVRGFFAGLAKKGIAVEVLERVRQVGPNKAGAKGSYTVYHLAMAPQA